MFRSLRLGLWVLFTMLGLGCLGIFADGLARDQHFGDQEVAVELAEASGWRSASFRVWGKDEYRLFLATVNHTPPFGVPYRGSIEVQVESPEGKVILHRHYEGAALDHLRPDNMHWSPLADLECDGAPFQEWTMRVRVVRPDTAFAGAYSKVTLKKKRKEVGAGGLIGYAMVMPGSVSLLLAFFLSLWIAIRERSLAPLCVSAALVLGLVLLLVSGAAGPGG